MILMNHRDSPAIASKGNPVNQANNGTGRENTMNFLSKRTNKHLQTLLLAAIVVCFSSTASAIAPVFSKTFSPDTIGPGGLTPLIFTINNSASSNAATSLAFTDTLPAGVTIATPAAVATTCLDTTISAPNGGSTITLSNGRLAANNTCTISVNVTSAVAGTHTNTTGNLTSSAGNSGTATDNLIVNAARPGFSKHFSPATVTLGARSTLTFTIDNSANTVQVFSASFSDTLPAGMEIASPSNASTSCSPGGVTALPGSNSISFTGGAVNAGATCTVSVDVRATSTGTLNNVSGALNAASSASGFAPVSSGMAGAILTVNTETIVFTQDFTNDPTPAGGTVVLSFTLTNNDRNANATSITFTDNLSTVLSGLVATGLPAGDICGSGSTLSGSSTLTLSNGSLAANGGSCTFNVTLQVPAGAATGNHVNTTSALSASIGGSSFVGSPSRDSLTVSSAPSISARFLNSPVSGGGTTMLEFTISSNSTSTTSNIAFTTNLDSFINGVTASALPTIGFCGSSSNATTTTVNGNITLGIANGELAAGTNCTFNVGLTVPLGAAAGTFTLTTETLTATVTGNSQTGGTTSAALTVVGAPTLTGLFINDPVLPGATATLQYTISHSAQAPTSATAITFSNNLSTTLAGLEASGLPMNNICGTGSSISGTTTLNFTAGSLAPGASCTFSITLNVPAAAVSGSFTNTTSNITATASGIAVSGNPAQDTLDIAALVFSKTFLNSPVIPGDTTTLRYTINNSQSTLAATGMVFSHSLNTVVSGLTVVAPLPTTPCGSGSLIVGTTPLIFSGGNLLAGETCSFDVTVRVPAGAASTTYASTTGNLSAMVGSSNLSLPPATAQLTVNSALLSLSATFTDDPVTAGTPVTLAFTLSNLNTSSAASNIAFTNNLGAAITGLVASGLPINNICGTGSSLSGTDTLTFTGGSLAASASCTFNATLTVPANSAGVTATNTTSGITGTINSLAITGPAASDNLVVSNPLQTPTISVGNPSASLTNGGPVTYQLTYTNALDVNLQVSAINLVTTGGASGTVSVQNGTTATPTVTISGISGNGTLGIGIAANTARSSSNISAGTATGTAFSVDNTAPGVTITTPSSNVNTAFTATFTFTENVTGFALSDINAGNATVTNFAGSNTTYTADITPTTEGTVTLDVAAAVAQDVAGNGNTAATQRSMNYDITNPGVTITTPSSDVNTTFTATFTFTENVTGFALSDINAGNATVANFAGSNTTYTADITPTTEGTVTLDVAAAVAQDVAGNGNTAATQRSMNYDITNPGVTITTPSSDVNTTFTATFTFTENVTGFALSDINAGNATVANFAGSNTTYTADITPTTEGTVTLDVAAAVAQDVAGNGNTAATQRSINYDITRPSVSIATNSARIIASGTVMATITFSEGVVGFDASDISVSNATLNNFSGSNNSYTVNITVGSAGTASIGIAANLAEDTTGNGNQASITTNIEVVLGNAGEDTDGDGLSDNLDTASTATTTDTDNDGITDAVERYLSGTTNSVNNSTDANANGIPDVVDVRLGVDPLDLGSVDFIGSTRPVITLTTPLTLASVAIVTAAPHGVTASNNTSRTAYYRRGACTGSILPANFASVCTSVLVNSSGDLLLYPGANDLWWLALDSTGNWPAGGAAQQTVNIVPLVSVSATNPTVGTGSTIDINAQLNGNPVDTGTAITVPFTVSTDTSGSATSNGTITLAAGSISGTTSFTAGANPGSLSVSLNTGAAPFAQNISAINPTTDRVIASGEVSQTIQVVSGNIAPTVTIRISQNGQTVSNVIAGSSILTLTAVVTDGNSGDTISYDWSATTAVTVPPGTTDSFTLAVPTAGLYELRVQVSDGTNSASGRSALIVEPSSLFSNNPTADSNNDGIPDIMAGLADPDGDRIPGFIDVQNNNARFLPVVNAVNTSEIITTEPGLTLRLGTIAASAIVGLANRFDATVTEGSVDSSGTVILPADSLSHPTAIVDFEVLNLPTTGQQVNVVIPLSNAIPVNPIYRKYLATRLPNFPARVNWVDFDQSTVNANGMTDTVVSAARLANGLCPGQADTRWRTALTQGDSCIRLTITDGGPNDADGEANNVITDPGGVTSRVLNVALSTLSSSITSLPADGSSSTQVTLNLVDAGSNPVLGATVTISGTGVADTTITATTDNGNGRYTAQVTAGTTTGTLTLSALVNDGASTTTITGASVTIAANQPAVTQAGGGGSYTVIDNLLLGLLLIFMVRVWRKPSAWLNE